MIIIPTLRIYGVVEGRYIPFEIYERIKEEYPAFLKGNETFSFSKEKIYLCIPFYNTLKSYGYIMDMLKKHNTLRSDVLEITEYTATEENDADVFVMYVSQPLQIEGTSADNYGTKYINCCPKCQLGGEPLDDVLVDRKFVKKCSIASLKNSDYFVSARVKKLIEDNGLTGVRFNHMVKDFKCREIPEYYYMTFDNILSPVDKRTLLNFSPPAYECKYCGKTVPYLKSHLYYKNEDLKEIKDFNLSYEFFNNYRMPYIIITNRVRNLFKEYKIRVGADMINIVNADGTISAGKIFR